MYDGYATEGRFHAVTAVKAERPLTSPPRYAEIDSVSGLRLNYRIGIRTQMSHECLIQFADIVSAGQSGQFIGRKVVWKARVGRFLEKLLVFTVRMVSLGSNSKRDYLGKR